MRCPKCEYEQPTGSTECVRCGLIFAKWRPVRNQAWPGPDDAAAPASARADRAPGDGVPGWLKLLALLAVGAGWYWFFFWAPRGLSVADQAYRDDARGFALLAPQGWQATKTTDCKDVGGPLTPAAACAVLDVTPSGKPPTPSIQVTMVPVSSIVKTGWGGTLVIEDRDKESLAGALASGLAKTLPGYVQERSDMILVDGIAALRLRGSATITGSPVFVGDSMVTVPNLFGRTPEHYLTMAHVLVPAGSNAYLITYVCNTADYERLAPTFEAVTGSFRVTRSRPTPFQAAGGLMGSIKGDAILGLLVSLTLALLKLR
jgi:hypothetical protein